MQKGSAKTLANPLQERKRQDSNLRTALGRSTVFEAASFSHSDTLPVLIPPTPFSRGRSGPTGSPSPLCLPCSPAPSRHLMMPCYFIGTLSQTLTLRAAFASSTYLLPQIPGPGRSSDDDLLNFPVEITGRIYGISTDLTSFSARFRKARPSGREDKAAGSPSSPFSRMLCTIGIWPRSGTPYFSAILRPPSLPKI